MLDLILIAAYFLLMLYFGWKSRHQSADAYWLADRSYSAGRITLSLVATIFGASSTMGIIGLGYSRGLTGSWWSLMGGIALIPLGFFLASRIRSSGVYTLPDILKRSYGEIVAVPAGLMIVIAWCGVISAQLIAGARLVSGLFPVDFGWALLIVAVVFTVYTFWGGQLSVIRTDMWQLCLFLVGLLLALLFLMLSDNLYAVFWKQVPAGYWDFPVSSAFSWYDLLVFYPLIVGLPYLVGPDIYSRLLCAKDHRVASKSALGAAAVVVPLSLLLAFFGLLVKARFPDIPPEAALPHTLDVIMPMGLKGLIVAGFLGAIMSSADTCLISASTILTLNVIRPILKVGPEKHLRITRVTVLVLGAIAWGIASRQQGIIASLLLGYTVFVGGVVVPTLATFFKARIRITPGGGLWAIIIGGGTAIFGKVQGGVVMKELLTAYGRHFLETVLGAHYLSILPVILSAVVLLLVSRMGGVPVGDTKHEQTS